MILTGRHLHPSNVSSDFVGRATVKVLTGECSFPKIRPTVCRNGWPGLVALEAMWATMRCTSSGCTGLARSLISCRIGSKGLEPHDPGHARKCTRPGRVLPGGLLSRHTFLSPWTGCDSEGEGCGERKQVRRKRGRSSWSGPVGILLNFVVCTRIGPMIDG